MYRNVDKESGTYQAWYDSLNDVLNEKPHAANANHEQIVDSGIYNRHKFGVQTWDDLNQLLEHGWSHGVEVARSLTAELHAPRLKNVRRVKRHSDFGDEVDMQAVYGGQLDRAWSTARRELTASASGNAITLVVGLSTAWEHDADELIWTGAVVTRLVDTLVQSGRNVRVIGTQKGWRAYEGNSEFTNYELAYIVKEYTDHTDLERLMLVLGHAGFYRMYGWRCMSAAPARLTCNLGMPVDRLPKLVEEREARNGIMYIGRVYTRDDAQALLTNTLAQFSGDVTR